MGKKISIQYLFSASQGDEDDESMNMCAGVALIILMVMIKSMKGCVQIFPGGKFGFL